MTTTSTTSTTNTTSTTSTLTGVAPDGTVDQDVDFGFLRRSDPGVVSIGANRTPAATGISAAAPSEPVSSQAGWWVLGGFPIGGAAVWAIVRRRRRSSFRF